MTNDEKVVYHSSNAFIHLSELLSCQLFSVSKESRQAIEATIAITDRLSSKNKGSEEVKDAG